MPFPPTSPFCASGAFLVARDSSSRKHVQISAFELRCRCAGAWEPPSAWCNRSAICPHAPFFIRGHLMPTKPCPFMLYNRGSINLNGCISRLLLLQSVLHMILTTNPLDMPNPRAPTSMMKTTRMPRPLVSTTPLG
jgi:hypothetical protein